MPEETTKISKPTDAEMAELMNMGGADNVITSDDINKNPLKRQNEDLDLSIIGDEKDTIEDETSEEKEARLAKEKLATADLNDVLALSDEIVVEEVKVTKDVTFAALEELVKDGSILLFEGDKPLKDYSKKEQIELIQANQERIREEEAAKTPAEFFDSLPPKLQYAASYVANGGKDLGKIFKFLSQTEEIASLDIKTEEGQEQTVRKYLTALGDNTPEEIEEEINSLKDLKTLEKKAMQVKPKLEAKQQQAIDKELKDQETRKAQLEIAATKHRENVIAALNVGDLNGVKMTSAVQGMLFNGLTQPTYKSVNGGNTNLLGYLLEQNNYVKPNPTLISKVLWLLKDEKGYEDAVKAVGNKEVVKEVALKLKTAANEKVTNSNQEVVQTPATKKTLTKPTVNIFARN